MAYYMVDEVLQHLKKSQETPFNRQRRSGYLKNALLIIDELGYQAMDRRGTHLFFQQISARYTKGSTIVTSNRSASE